MPLRELLAERRESVLVKGGLGDWQAITIKFSGEVLPRDRAAAFKGAMFAAYPGDLLFSKIDARNGAIGLIPETIAKAVVTSEYPVFIPKADKLRPLYLRHLLQASHFRADLQSKASGTSGRKRVTPEGFLSLNVPVPTLPEQDALIASYMAALKQAAQLEQEADSAQRTEWQSFELASGLAASTPLPDRPVFVARFKDVDRWSHDGILRVAHGATNQAESCHVVPLESALMEVRHGCSLSPAKRVTTLRILKISAVTKGHLNLDEYKHIKDDARLREQFSLKAGDILMCRTNGTLAYVGMSALVKTDIEGTIFPDKVIRVRPDENKINSEYLWLLLQLPPMRKQIEGAARTAVGNYAIGSKDIKALKIPLPPITEQQKLFDALHAAMLTAQEKRTEAAVLRQSAWAAFESTVFNAIEKATQ